MMRSGRSQILLCVSENVHEVFFYNSKQLELIIVVFGTQCPERHRF